MEDDMDTSVDEESRLTGEQQRVREAELVYTAVGGNCDAVRSMIEVEGLSVDSIDTDGTTVLCAAAFARAASDSDSDGWANLLQYLLDKGADITSASTIVSRLRLPPSSPETRAPASHACPPPP